MNYLMLLTSAYLALINSQLGSIKLDEREWSLFKDMHGKEYESDTMESMRRSIFAYNKHTIDQFNANQSEEAGFSLGVNHLTDISQIEIKARNGFRLPEKHLDANSGRLLHHNSDKASAFLASILADNTTVPDEIDWRKVPGRVSKVKDQGNCGSCWAFSTTGVLEGQEVVRGKSAQIELSEQNLVDCAKGECSGCDGGFMKDALDFVHTEGGIDDERSYPYDGQTKTCRYKPNKSAFTDQGAVIMPEGDEEKLKQVVAKFGPVAVAIDASSIWFQFYRKGVFYNKHCKNKPDDLDHAVLVVGYGTDPKKGDYWIVKNSWGTSFGEHGYIRMARNRKNNCGIATVPTIPTF